ncbi:RNA-directed DNA polymerase from mobile element jockey-like protein [Willisornis vidua]|uniref:RNA-directed DNA polymerase from mobile element jockey-like protein n=1 Tax=Willisornis vidua TaxID=1566151 RepID=A0ABQ9D994_9PASS|nr:RNA-directed DNA polymerase from mobile element jockey-like protein [Willisornis vidua]
MVTSNRDMDKTKVFNAFFASVFHMDDESMVSQCLSWRSVTVRMVNSQMTLMICRTCCSSWIPTNLRGLMGFHQRPADVITKPLSIIFEQSWEPGEVSDDWKLANITLIFNRGKKEDSGNYRPVSLTSESGKVMEKTILRGIEKHLKGNAAIGHPQHSFMRGKSCLFKLFSFHNRVPHLAEQGNPVDIMFLDFGKAFNTVSHGILQNVQHTAG